MRERREKKQSDREREEGERNKVIERKKQSDREREKQSDREKETK